MRTQVDPKSAIAGLNNRDDWNDPATIAHVAQLAEAYQNPAHTIPDPVWRILPDGKVQIVCGECRTRGAIKAGLALFWVDLRENMSDADALQVMFNENEGRRDTNYLQKAAYFQRYAIEIMGMSAEAIDTNALSAALGNKYTPDLITRRLLLLRLTPEYQHYVSKNLISLEAAEAIARLDVNRQRLCYQAWLMLSEDDRTNGRLLRMVKKYKADADAEIAAQMQGDMFGGLDLSAPVQLTALEWEAQFGVTAEPVKTAKQQLADALERAAKAEQELQAERERTAKAKTIVRGKFAAERAANLKLQAQVAELIATLAAWKQQTAPVPNGTTLLPV